MCMEVYRGYTSSKEITSMQLKKSPIGVIQVYLLGSLGTRIPGVQKGHISRTLESEVCEVLKVVIL